MAIIDVSDVKQFGRIDTDVHDVLLQKIVDAVISFTESYCAIKLSSAEYTEKLNGGGGALFPDNKPVTALDKVEDLWNSNEEITDDLFHTNTQIRFTEGGMWPAGEYRWNATYTAGYTDSTAPNGLVDAMLQMCIRCYNNPDLRKASREVKTNNIEYRILKDSDALAKLDQFSMKRFMD